MQQIRQIQNPVFNESTKPFFLVFYFPLTLALHVTAHCKIHILLEISQQEINAVVCGITNTFRISVTTENVLRFPHFRRA